MKIASDHALYVPGAVRLDDISQQTGAEHFVLHCCGHIPRNRDWDFTQVFSPFWRLYYNFTRGHHVVADDQVIALGPGCILLIPENILFHCVADGNVANHLYIHFIPSPGCTPLLTLPCIINADTVSRAMARQLACGLSHVPRDATNHRAAAFVHWALSQLPDGLPIVRNRPLSLQKVLAFVENHLGEKLSNEVLARIAGVSQRGLARLFQNEMHTAPQTHVRTVRIREAARALAHGEASIEHIAERFGFPNRYYFTRCFSRQLGCTPGAFRKKSSSHGTSSHP